MDVLRKPWLGRAVRETLTKIIQWQSRGTPTGIKDNYQIVGSSVWVKMGKSNPLQIVKFLTFNGEIQAWLSDTEKIVDVIFSLSAVDGSRAGPGRRFTDGAAGGIIFLADYEIRVLRPASAPQPRLVLYVHSASPVRSGGEGLFGHPSHIRHDREINDLLATISAFDLSNHGPTENNMETELLAESQSSDGQLDREQQKSATGEGTQIEFATQIYQPQLATSNRRGSVPSHEDVSAKIKERAKANKLLGVLLPEKRAVLGRGTLRKNKLRATQEATESPPSTLEKGTLSAADICTRESTLDSISEAVSTVHFGGVNQAETRTGESVDHEGDNTSAMPGNEIGHTNKAGVVAASRATTSPEGWEGTVVEKGLTTDPWAGMTRIPRREVRVPADQDDLLSNKNCWIPPEPGNRLPVGNIPVPILRSLAAKAERSALKEREAATAKVTTGADPQSESSSSNGSDSDTALDWSPSPDGPRYVRADRTPVDSSPVRTSLTYYESRAGAAHRQPKHGEDMHRRKHEEFLSDDRESSPTAKRQRKEKEQCLAQKGIEDIRDQSSLRNQGVRSRSPLAGQQDVGGNVSSLPGGSTGRCLAEASDSKSEGSDDLRSQGELVSMSTPESAFSPIGSRAQASQYICSHQQARIGNGQAASEAEHAETEMEINSQKHLRKRERLDLCVDAAARQVSYALGTQDRSSVSGGKVDGLDSDEEHELEISLPAALGDEVDSVGLSSQNNLTPDPHQPSTAPQPRKSVLLVKQTPQLHGEATGGFRHDSPVSRKGVGSPSRRGGTDLSSASVVPCTFPNAEDLVEDPVRAGGECEQASGKGAGNFSEDSLLASSLAETKYRHYSQLHPLESINDKKEPANSSLETESAPGDLMQVATLGDCEVREVNSIACAIGGEQRQIGGYASRVVVSTQKGEPNESEEMIREPGKVVQKRQHSKTEETQQSGSRKRPKRFKLPASFAFSEENRQFLDPSEIARTYRQEFFTGLSRQPSPALELSSTPPSAQGGKERNIENRSMDRSAAKGPGTVSHVTVDSSFRGVGVDTHKETAGGDPVVEKQVVVSVERASRGLDGGWQRQRRDGNSDESGGERLEKRHSKLRSVDRDGTEESIKDAFPAAEKSRRIVLIERQSTGSTLMGNASGQDPQKLPLSDTLREAPGQPEVSIVQNHSSGPMDRAPHDFGAEYGSLTTPAERLALLKALTGDKSPTFEAYTDTRILNTLKNVVTIKQISREEFSRVLLQIRKSLDSNGWIAQTPGPSGSLKPSPRASSKPILENPAISTPASSNTPLKVLLSSPAHMKAKGPSSVLDWLEKTSSVDSESAEDLSDPQEQKWWHDQNTPFKEWSRAYVSLKSVNGMMGGVDREKGKIVPPREKMDVLGWNF
ncbi:hypothetical protein GP486_002165 [Trichoglossum hirsutum]|uniref:Shelterin complex subunit TPP1/Est3 domain-containing protein n=1 Tax=Trichoglossum hirsutum TaxID=265104 RepID=A0A9P8RRY6_9PEZI|nr:hypothetical protein GP486_002165 [Trichoglossum hirsutum]